MGYSAPTAAWFGHYRRGFAAGSLRVCWRTGRSAWPGGCRCV